MCAARMPELCPARRWKSIGPGIYNAKTLTSTQTDIVQRLTMNLMGQLTDAHSTVLAGLQSALLGRTEPDIYRALGWNR